MKPKEQKAIRLVLDGKVSIRWRGEGTASGVVEGEHGVYKTSYSPAGRMCECPASVDCSHAIALELAVLREADERLSDTR